MLRLTYLKMMSLDFEAAEKRKLRSAQQSASPEPSMLKEKAPADPARPRQSLLGWLLIIAGVLLLFATLSGANIWAWWWLIFLAKPLFWGGWSCKR